MIYDYTSAGKYFDKGRALRALSTLLKISSLIYTYWYNNAFLKQQSEDYKNIMNIMGGLKNEEPQED